MSWPMMEVGRTLLHREMPMTAHEVCIALGISRNTLKRIDPEYLPFFRVGARGDRRYRVTDVIRYVEERATWTKSPSP